MSPSNLRSSGSIKERKEKADGNISKRNFNRIRKEGVIIFDKKGTHKKIRGGNSIIIEKPSDPNYL